MAEFEYRYLIVGELTQRVQPPKWSDVAKSTPGYIS
jgi:hypothetical protein